MTAALIFISNVLTGGIRIFGALFLIHRLLDVRRPDGKTAAAGLAGMAGIALLLTLWNLPLLYRIGLESIWIVFCAYLYQKANARLSLFVSFFYEIGLLLWNFLIAAGMGMIWNSEIFLNPNSLYGQAAGWMCHILLIILIFYVAKHPDMTGKEGFRLASCLSVAGFIATITLSSQTVLYIPADTIELWVILEIILLMSILVFNMKRQYELEKELAELKTEQTELLERDYTALNRAYGVNAGLFHDFHNHIGALRQLLTHQKYDEAISYLNALQEPVREITDVRTGDETVDYLINSKMAAAATEGISFQAEVEYPRHTNIRSADMCAILGNLLDNALEASRNVPDPEKRMVCLTIRRINQMLVIKVENRFNGYTKRSGGNLETTKTEEGLHGWGLKSARAAAEKYDGMLNTSFEDGLFRVIVTLSYQGVLIK